MKDPIDPHAPLDPLVEDPDADGKGGKKPPPPTLITPPPTRPAATPLVIMPKVGDTVTYKSFQNGPSIVPVSARVRRVVDAKRGLLDLDVHFAGENGSPNIRVYEAVPAESAENPHSCWCPVPTATKSKP